MNLKNFSLFSLFVILLVLASCENDDKPMSVSKHPMQLVGEVESTTRVSGSSWDEEDQIGVFGKESSYSSLNEGLLENLNNQMFSTTGDGVFKSSDIIYYPEGKKIDLIAYYPYQEGVSDFNYKINLQDQSTLSDLDLLYANNVKGIGEGVGVRPTLQFERQLALLTLEIYPEKKEGVLKPEKIEKIELQGLPTRADFSLETGKIENMNENDMQSVTLHPSYVDKHLIVEAIVIPISDLSQAKIVITTKEGLVYPFHLKIQGELAALEKGKNYTFTLELSGTKGEEEEDPIPTNGGFTECPDVTNSKFNATIAVHYLSSVATRSNEKIRNYTVYYDTYYKLSHWVAYPLHPCYTIKGKDEDGKDVSRTDAWQYDPAFLSKDQPNLKEAWADYNRLEYDRGHQIASADRLCSKEANAQTFYYTNMTAQKADLNQKKWNELEVQLRKWSDRAKDGYDTLFVVTGAIIPTPPEKIEWAYDKFGGKAVIPSSYYKVLMQKKGENTYTIGFEMENKIAPKPLSSYEKTVAELEKKTGFTFFPTLSKEEKESIDRSFWTYN